MDRSRRALLIRGLQACAGVVTLSAGAATLPAAAPAHASGLAIKLLRAEAWSKLQVGSKAWGTGSNTYCLRFAANAYGGAAAGYATAIAAFRAIGRSGMPTARGQMVFFHANKGNGNAGHVGIFLGGDQMVSVTTTGVRITSISGWSRSVAPLAGHANPPTSWPGR